jgi:hypothetical protein
MALTKVSRGLLTTSIVDNGNATAITIGSDESVALSGTFTLPNANGTNEISFTGTEFTNVLSATTSGFQLGTTGAGYLSFLTNNTERLAIDASGNIIQTGANSATLTVKAPTDNASLTLQAGSSDTGAEGAFVNFLQNTTYKWQMGMNTDNSFRWYNYAASSEAMRIDSSGNLGIGNTNPSGYTGAGADNLVVGNNNSSNSNGISIVAGSNAFSGLAFTDTTGAGDGSDHAGLVQYGHADNSMRFFTNTSEKMRILADGSITMPEVYNDTTAAAANMHISSAGGLLFRSTSSARYKNTITDATHGLTELLTLRPVTYKGNNDGDTVFGGLIAEEVHDAGLTEFVQYNDEDEPDALAYGNIVSLCIKAIQELKEELNTATARITELENN